MMLAPLYGYAALSAVVAGAVVANAVTAREQFYSTVVYLTNSKGSLMVRGRIDARWMMSEHSRCMAGSGELIIVLGVLFGQVTKKAFLGTLRDPEVEVRVRLMLRMGLTRLCTQHLNERIWPTSPTRC